MTQWSSAIASRASQFLNSCRRPYDYGRAWTFSERFQCKTCKIIYQDPEPSLFSFNPYGACPRCQGFGNTVDFDLDLVIPDKNESLAGGAIEPSTKPRYRIHLNELRKAARAKKIRVDVPYHGFPRMSAMGRGGQFRVWWRSRFL